MIARPAIRVEERMPLARPPAPSRLRALFGVRAPKAPSALPPGLRVYAVGDIHGRLDLLDPLLDAIRADHAARPPGADVEVILLGDLIDRGPQSAGVVERAMNPPDWARFHTIMGNHEHAMVETLSGDRSTAGMWLANGGVAALASWGVSDHTLRNGSIDEVIEAGCALVPRAVRLWMARLPVRLHRGDYYFVHAGVRPGVPLDQQALSDALWIRNDFLHDATDHGPTIVHGHTVTDEVDERANRIGIDTGAHQSGRLTALALEGTRRWTLQTGG